MDLEINIYVGNYFLWEKDDLWWSQISFTIFGIFFPIISNISVYSVYCRNLFVKMSSIKIDLVGKNV